MAVHRMLKDLVLMLAVISTSLIVFTFCTALVFKGFSPPDAFEATFDMAPELLVLLIAISAGGIVGRLLRLAKNKNQSPAGVLRLRDDRQQQEPSS
ncbi:hypothetical protein ACSDR0_30085 [Streptosporangium sp. G11]|uniref:hypothetical protein n=1 Tax=Streptosporangium sp. G11 TaxID=3436926 RepID=UPI003EBF34FF